MPVSVEFTNMPDGVTQDQFSVKYSVSSLNIAGEAATIDKMDSVSIGTIDFSQLSNSANTFSFDASSIPGIKVRSKISTIEVNVDLSSFKSKKITLPASAIEIVNESAFKVNLNEETVQVTVAGLTDAVDSVKVSDLSAAIKVDEDAKVGENQTFDLSIKVTNRSGIWAAGQYKIHADITQ